MKQTRLGNICRDILMRWREKRSVDEELVYIFFDGILDMLHDSEKDNSIPDYRKVTDRLQDIWQYKDFDKMSKEEIFLYGGLWGGMQMAEINVRRKRQEKSVDELVCAYKNKQWFFDAIASQPGIRHKELAERGNQSTSQLSQFVIKAAKEKLITYNRIGREKYYYLGKKGELVYEKMKKRKARMGFCDRKWHAIVNSNNVDQSIGTSGLGLYNFVLQKDFISPGSRANVDHRQDILIYQPMELITPRIDGVVFHNWRENDYAES